MSSVYLAGPITGLLYDGATQWRDEFTKMLDPSIKAFSPMRHKSYLAKGGVILDQYDQETTGSLSTQKGIMVRDFFDCTNCKLIVVNLLGAKTPSLGTCMEVAWGYQLHKPIVAIMEPEGNVHDHAMIREAIGFRTTSLREGADVVNSILTTGY